MFDRSLVTASVRTAFLVLLSGLFAWPVSAQIDTGQQRDAFNALSGMDLNPLQQMSGLRGMSEMVPLEGAVDASSYIVGPGDLFDVSVGGPQPLLVTLPVSADGYLMLPDAGAVDVAGKTLADVRQQARQAVRRQFQNVQVEVTLSQPRQFYVHLSGAVPTPGRYIATPVARVATVLSMAFADTTRAPVSNQQFRPALRNVKLLHKDGQTQTVDLLRYFSTGDTDHNPYLRDGDVISVPTYDPDYEAVFVSGKVAFPGTYDHRADDTLESLLALATGDQSPSVGRVRVTRSNDDGTVDADLYEGSNVGRGVRIRQRDQVHVLLEETVRGSAAIEGWVEYPGTYSIIPGRTTLRNLLELAGGLRPGSLERGAYLQRATLPLPEPQLKKDNRFEIRPDDFRMIRADTLAIMQSTRLARMDFLSRAYLAHELRLQNRVPVNLEATLDGSALPITLQSGDRVYVPRDENTVFVLGQVNRPGYVTYQPEMSYNEYVAASGGLGDNAGEAYVIKAGTGQFVIASAATIESGDRIFVDRSEMIADTPELQRLLVEDRRADLEERSRLFQSILQSVSTAAAIVTTYLLITKK